jgi:hypothetical protein
MFLQVLFWYYKRYHAVAADFWLSGISVRYFIRAKEKENNNVVQTLYFIAL